MERNPTDRPTDRADSRMLWRRCVADTLRAARLARQRGGWVSRPNLERAFTRRWWKCSPGVTEAERETLSRLGRTAVREAWKIR